MSTPGSSSKKPKSSCLLYLLGATLIGILLCAAVILYLTVIRKPESDGPDILNNTNSLLMDTTLATSSSSSFSITTTPVAISTLGTTSPTTSPSSSESSTTPLEGLESSTSSSPSTTTTAPTTTAEEIVLPVDVDSILKDQHKDFEKVEKCALLEALPVTCSQTPKDSTTKPTPSDFKPIHYNLNLTLRDIRKPVLEGYAQIFASTISKTNGITLHAAKIHNLENRDRIRLLNCQTGETICISNIQVSEDGQVFLETAQNLEANTDFRLDIDGFISADSGPSVYKQIPTTKWRVPMMIGTVFEPTSARHVFPSFDNHVQKASLSLCFNHGQSMTALSNSMISKNSDPASSGVSCFEKTVPLTAQQMSFVAFEKTSSLFYNRTTVDGVYLPEIEMVFNLNSNFKPTQYEWIYNETSKVMALLTKWSAFSYPLNRLSVIVAPVMAGHSALGVITLPAQAVAYQKHTSTHETLIKEVIGQWMEGVVTTEHTCFEKALITYLEWKVNEELQIVKKTRKAEISRIRPRNLNETQDQLRVIRDILPNQQKNSAGLCSPRFVEVFYTLDETYGSDTVIGIIKVIFDKFAFSTAAISDWQEAAQKATGRDEAGKIIGEWFSRQLSRPILKAHVQSQSVEFQQLTNETWSIPLEIAGSSGMQLAVITEQKQSIPFVSSDYVVVDPDRKSHAFVVYDADTYLRLIRCFGDSRCPSKEIKGVFADLAAALIANVLPVPDNADIAKWKSVFKFMAQQNLVEGTAACCVEHAIREMRKCSYWDIQDVCTKIHFNTVLAAVA